MSNSAHLTVGRSKLDDDFERDARLFKELFGPHDGCEMDTADDSESFRVAEFAHTSDGDEDDTKTLSPSSSVSSPIDRLAELRYESMVAIESMHFLDSANVHLVRAFINSLPIEALEILADRDEVQYSKLIGILTSFTCSDYIHYFIVWFVFTNIRVTNFDDTRTPRSGTFVPNKYVSLQKKIAMFNTLKNEYNDLLENVARSTRTTSLATHVTDVWEHKVVPFFRHHLGYDHDQVLREDGEWTRMYTVSFSKRVPSSSASSGEMRIQPRLTRSRSRSRLPTCL